MLSRLMQDSIAGRKFCKIVVESWQGYGFVELPNRESQKKSVQRRKPRLKANYRRNKDTCQGKMQEVPCIRYMHFGMQSEQQQNWEKPSQSTSSRSNLLVIG